MPRVVPITPSTIVGALIAVAAAVGAGSQFGYTLEPEATTAMRTELAVCAVKLTIYEDAARTAAGGAR